MTPTQQAREHLETKQKELAAIFEAHPTRDFSEDTIKDIRARNDELADLGKKWETLREVDLIAEENQKAMEKANAPQRQHPIPGGGGTGEGTRFAPAEVNGKSLGQRFIESQQYQKARGEHGQDIKAQFDHVDARHLVTSMKTLVSETGTGFSPPNPRTSILILSAQPTPVVSDLIPTSPTNLTSIKFMEETTFDNEAAWRNEGAVMGESGLAYTERNFPVESLATVIPVTQEQVDDIDGMMDLIDNRLRLMLALKEEFYLLQANGTLPQIQGFYTKSGVQALTKQPGENYADPIYRAMIAIMYTGFTNPTGAIYNPLDYQNVRLMKSSDGLYIWGSPADPNPIERIFGLPVVKTVQATQGTVLVGDFQKFSHISRRQDVRLDVTNSNSDDFTKNRLSIRMTMRESLEIYRPSAFALVTGL